MDGERVPVPVRPFWAVKVRVVDPECPGLAMLMVAGFAATVNAPPTSITSGGDAEPLKFESPLYCTVMLSRPSGICVV